MDLFEMFDAGAVMLAGKRTEISRLAWNPHKDFKGVFLKNVLSEDQTDGLLACKLVRIEPNRELGMHTHPDSMELHEVIAGGGVCITKHGETSYIPGTISLIARNAPHAVRAGENGLCFFAKFVTVRA